MPLGPEPTLSVGAYVLNMADCGSNNLYDKQASTVQQSTLLCGVDAACTAEHYWTYCNVSLLPLPLYQELHNFDSIQLILSDCLQLLQAVNIIASSPVSQQWFVDFLTRPATMKHVPFSQHMAEVDRHASRRASKCGCSQDRAGTKQQLLYLHAAVHT